MYSTEKLIMEVQKYPCIWKIDSSDYVDKDMKNSCWIKVTEEVYSHEWDNLSAAEQEEKIQELRNKKWRHIRDAYLKYITKEKNGTSGSEGMKRKPYAYAKAMAFLTTTYKKRKRTNHFETVKDDHANSSEDMDDTSINVPSINAPVEANLKVLPSSYVTHQTYKPDKKMKITPFQSNLLEHLKKSQETELNPDKNIVMSFLPYLKQLNNEQKLDFQINGLQYLKELMKQQNSPTD